MTHTYSVQGMTCNNCRSSVEQKLNSIDGVEKATVDLSSETATIDFSHHLPVEALQTILPEKFTISEIASKVFTSETPNVFGASAQESELSKFQQLKPLFLIFGIIILMTLALNFKAWDTSEAMLDAMGIFFFIFSLFKLFDLKGFSNSFSMYDPIASILPAYGKIYPFIELSLGVLFLARIEIPILLLVTILILGITTIGVTRSLFSKKNIKCACLGSVLDLPMTEATFIENAIMIVMAIILLVKTFA